MNIAPQALAWAASPPILWDLVERHVDEAEFLFEQWESALGSPRYRWTELVSTVERRLLGHLDGINVAGAAAVDRLLLPALGDPKEPHRVTVSALALLAAGNDGREAVFQALHSGEESLRHPLSRALKLFPDRSLNDRLQEQLKKSQDPWEKAAFLSILTSRGVDPGGLVASCIAIDHLELITAVLEMIRRFSRRDLSFMVDKYSQSVVPSVRISAIKAGLTLGLRDAWPKCLEWAETSRSPGRDLLELVAIVGLSKEQGVLYRQLEKPETVEAALWALGFAGTVAAGDACIGFLNGKNPRTSKLAANALSWMGGIDPYADHYQRAAAEPTEEETLPALENDDLDADLRLDGVAELPLPEPRAITRWWQTERLRIGGGARHILGRPFSLETLGYALEAAPLWRRHTVALELAICTSGARQTGTDLFSIGFQHGTN